MGGQRTEAEGAAAEIRNPTLEIRNKSQKPKKRKWDNETARRTKKSAFL